MHIRLVMNGSAYQVAAASCLALSASAKLRDQRSLRVAS